IPTTQQNNPRERSGGYAEAGAEQGDGLRRHAGEAGPPFEAPPAAAAAAAAPLSPLPPPPPPPPLPEPAIRLLRRPRSALLSKSSPPSPIDDWRDIALPRDFTKPARVRTLGANSTVTGFGYEYDTTSSTDIPSNQGPGSDSGKADAFTRKKRHSVEWWFEEDGLFNVDEEGRAEKQQCAVAASNIVRNFSFMPENEVVMVQHRHCLETIFQSLEDQNTEDEELITNMLETIVNLAPVLDLRIFSSNKPSYIRMTEKRAVQAVMGMLGSSIKAWHCAAAELLGRLIINPDNEPFLLPSVPQIYKRLVDLLSLPAVDAQAAAVGALYNLTEVNMDCRLKLASERWAVDRLFKVVRAPHPVPEICRKAALVLESLVSEPQNRPLLLAHESTFAEILMSDGKHADTFARILYELTSRPNNKATTARGVWGM
ncbi:Armadillo repeat-containing protein LFR, partial [Ananas comosus]